MSRPLLSAGSDQRQWNNEPFGVRVSGWGGDWLLPAIKGRSKRPPDWWWWQIVGGTVGGGRAPYHNGGGGQLWRVWWGSWFRWGRVFKGGEGGEGGPRQVLSLKLSHPVLLHHGSMNLGLAKFRPEISM